MKLVIGLITLLVVFSIQLSVAVSPWKQQISEELHIHDDKSYERVFFIANGDTPEDLQGTGTCPDGSLYFCKYGWMGNDYQFTGGMGGSVSVTITAGNATWGSWFSTGWIVKAVIVKGGDAFFQTNYSSGITSGTFDNSGLPFFDPPSDLTLPDILYVRFCGIAEPTTTTTHTTTISTTTTTHSTSTTSHSCENNCPHGANITVNDYNSLTVNAYNDSTIFEFCQTSTYLGPDTSVVLGFDPYDTCHLNERGTCDNKHTIIFPSETMCVKDPKQCMYPCVGNGINVSFNIIGLSSHLQWDNTLVHPVFVEDDVTGIGHLFGYLKDPSNPDLKLHVTIWFNDLYAPGIIPPGSPVKQLPSQCYTGNTNSSLWSYYHDITGSITGVPGTGYDGLIISVTSVNHAPQVGYGANGKNLHAGIQVQFTWTIIHQPYDLSLALSETAYYSYLTVDLTDDCTNPEEYCGLFGEPEEDAPNGWVVSINQTTSLITYCANFTIEELLGCRMYGDRYTPLFTVSEEDNCENCIITYTGQLYQATVLADNCENWSEGDSCGEVVALSSCYNITLELDTGGSIDVSFVSNDIDFCVQWLYNVWLCGEDAGNLKVVLKTNILQNCHPDIHLCNPSVDTETETGYPLVFVDPLDPECEIIDDNCFQVWSLRTFGAENVVDFSGFKLLKWDVCKGDVIVGHVSANYNLHAKHMGNQIHLDGKVNAGVTLYVDPAFEHHYDGTQLVDCQTLYGKVCLTTHEHLDTEIRKVYICFSAERDLIPFDPMHPETTGCNTPGDDVIKILIYSINPWESDTIDQNLHEFIILEDVETDVSCEPFQFTVFAYTQYEQFLQIVWCAHEYGGFGGLVESINEYTFNDGSFFQRRREHQENERSFVVNCPDDWFFDWTARRCHESHRSRELDDDDDDGPVHFEDQDFDDFATVLAILFFFILIMLMMCCCNYWHAYPVVAPVEYSQPLPPIQQQQQQQQNQQQTINVHNNNYVNTQQQQQQQQQQQELLNQLPPTPVYNGGYIHMDLKED
jgi:hypothetical protein